MNIISINGKLLPLSEAHLSVDERGFRFGDGVFETIPFYDQKPYLLEYHLERLHGGLNALGIKFTTVLAGEIHTVIKANDAKEGTVRIYVSRGIGSRGYMPLDPAPASTTVIQLLPPVVPMREAVTLWLSSYEKTSPRALPTQYKLAQGVNSTLARMEAHTNGAYEALQISAQKHISEASSANIFWVSSGTLFTPALSTGALAGVTRRRIMELSPLPVVEVCEPVYILEKTDEVFLTNASYGVVKAGSILPLGYTWKNHSFAEQLSELRSRDIKEYTAQKS